MTQLMQRPGATMDLVPSNRQQIIETLINLDGRLVEKWGEKLAYEIADLAILYGANPFPGPAREIHTWEQTVKIPVGENPDGSKIYKKFKVPQIYFGIHFFRRMAALSGGIAWKLRPVVYNEKAHGPFVGNLLSSDKLASEDPYWIGAIAIGARADRVEHFCRIGAPWSEAKDAAAHMSFATVDSRDVLNKWEPGKTIAPPAARSWSSVALRRAEIGLLRDLQVMTLPSGVEMPTAVQLPEYKQEVIQAGKKEEMTVDETNAYLGLGNSDGLVFSGSLEQYSADGEEEVVPPPQDPPIVIDSDTGEILDEEPVAQVDTSPAGLWTKQLEGAQTKEAFVTAVYHLNKKVIGNARNAKKAFDSLFGPVFILANRPAYIEAMNVYVQARADGASVADAKEVAKARFEKTKAQ